MTVFANAFHLNLGAVAADEEKFENFEDKTCSWFRFFREKACQP